MKKLFLTVCAAALFAAAAIGQEEQDTAQQESSQYRPMPQTQDATDYVDTTGIEQGIEYRNQELEQTEHNLDSTFNQLNRELEEEEQNIRDEGEQAEQNLEQDMENAEQEMEETGEDLDRNAEELQDTLQDGEEPRQPRDQDRDLTGLTAEDIEVLDSKEGPNHEVVYKINGDLFYVDREKKELVKVRRSDLRNSKHEVQVKEGIASGDDSKMKNKRSKG